jgi:TatD DNase family protein
LPAREAIAEAAEAGVVRIVTIGVGRASSERAIALAQAHAGVSATVGVHPHDASTFTPPDLEWLRELGRHPQVVAIGECGLDYFRDHSPREIQAEAFIAQLGLARGLGLPVVIHTREAADDTLRILAEHGEGLEIILHCFTLTEHLGEVLSRGYWVSFAGPVTYKKSDELRRAAARVPSDRMLVETDSPYLAPEPRRGRPNRPANVAHTLAAIAKVRGTSPEELDAVTSANAARVFGW